MVRGRWTAGRRGRPATAARVAGRRRCARCYFLAAFHGAPPAHPGTGEYRRWAVSRWDPVGPLASGVHPPPEDQYRVGHARPRPHGVGSVHRLRGGGKPDRSRRGLPAGPARPAGLGGVLDRCRGRGSAAVARPLRKPPQPPRRYPDRAPAGEGGRDHKAHLPALAEAHSFITACLDAGVLLRDVQIAARPRGPKGSLMNLLRSLCSKFGPADVLGCACSTHPRPSWSVVVTERW